MKDELLVVNELKTTFHTEKGKVKAVDGISFSINSGETLGIVGESGCGKSVTAESIMRLLDERNTIYEGEIYYKGQNLLELKRSQMRKIRGNKISMVFQDPMTSLNPVFTIGHQISEAIELHQNVTKKEAFKVTLEMLSLTGISSPESRYYDYPHELSGGMRQRIMIALALSCQPSLLIADEPTTALDVTIQAQILEVINNLKKELNMGVIMITHDLGVVAEVCTKVVVMYLGQVIEESEVNELFSNPLHPYTKGLLKCVPTVDTNRKEKLHIIKGVVPSLDNIPKGCRFADRCEFSDNLCKSQDPILEKANPNHKVRCWHYESIKNNGG